MIQTHPGVMGVVGGALIENQEKTVFEKFEDYLQTVFMTGKYLKALTSLSNCESICPYYFISLHHLSDYPSSVPMTKHKHFSASQFFPPLIT